MVRLTSAEAVRLRARLRAIDDEFAPLMNRLLGKIDGARVLALGKEADDIEERLAVLDAERDRDYD